MQPVRSRQAALADWRGMLFFTETQRLFPLNHLIRKQDPFDLPVIRLVLQ